MRFDLLKKEWMGLLLLLPVAAMLGCSGEEEIDLSGIGAQAHGGVEGLLPNSFIISCEDDIEGIYNGRLHLYFSAEAVASAGANPILTFSQNIHDINSTNNTRLDVLVYDYEAGTWYITGEDGLYYTYSSAFFSQVNESDDRLEGAAYNEEGDSLRLQTIDDERYPSLEGLDVYAGVYAGGIVVVGGERGILYMVRTGTSETRWDSLNAENPFLGTYDVVGFAYNHVDDVILVAGASQHDRGQLGGSVSLIEKTKIRDRRATNWSSLTNPLRSNHSPYSAAYGNGKYVVVGGDIGEDDDLPSIAVSSNGSDWILIDKDRPDHSHMDERYTLLHVIYGWDDNRFVALGSKGKILYSTDSSATNWVAVSDANLPLKTDPGSIEMYNNGQQFVFSGITYLNGAFVAVGGYRSLNGHRQPTNPSGSLYGRILISQDGASWSYLLNTPFSLVEGVGIRSIQGVGNPTR